VLSLELGILSIERRRTPDHLDDDGSCLLREPFGDRARFLVDQAAKLHLHQLSRAQRLAAEPVGGLRYAAISFSSGNPCCFRPTGPSCLAVTL
jgi:hypothetical protein